MPPTLDERLARPDVDPTMAMILRAMAQAGSPGTAAVPRETLEAALGQPLPSEGPATLGDRFGAVASWFGNAIPGRGGVGKLPDVASLLKSARERFGLTRNIDEAGYLLPSGEMLDFSGRGGAVGYRPHGQGFVPTAGKDYLAGQRSVDHREIVSLLGDAWHPLDRTSRMGEFMKHTGAVRLGAPGAHLAQPPTPAQLRAIVQMARSRGDDLILDVDVPGGEVVSRTFARPTVDAVAQWLATIWDARR